MDASKIDLRRKLAAHGQDIYHYCLAIVPSLDPAEESAFAGQYVTLSAKLIAYASIERNARQLAGHGVSLSELIDMDILRDESEMFRQVERIFSEIQLLGEQMRVDVRAGELVRQ